MPVAENPPPLSPIYTEINNKKWMHPSNMASTRKRDNSLQMGNRKGKPVMEIKYVLVYTKHIFYVFQKNALL